jgi:two-component system, NtrC family, sensor kinase
MNKSLRVLHVEDSMRDVALLQRHLTGNGYELVSERVDTPAAMTAALLGREWDVILCDYSMPQFDALQALIVLNKTGLEIPFIIISGTVGEAAAVEAMRAGAHDYLMKDNLVRLAPTIDRELQEAANRRARQNAEAERKLAQEGQQASELRYRRLFENAKDGILIIDATSGEIVDANPYIIATLGYSYEELVGKELWEIGAFKDIAASKKAFEELQEKAHVSYDDLPLETRAGLAIEVEFVSNVYLVGASRVIQWNIRDISERKLGKRALIEANSKLQATLAELTATTQQLWEASRLATMGELAASVAHELNNPLATISLHLELLNGQLATDDPKRKAVAVIDEEVDRMATLVSNLLLFSRRSHPQISSINIGEELQSSLEFIHYQLRSRSIKVELDIEDDLPNVHADRQQLRQVFLNLLTNASDAMPEGGTLTLRARRGLLVNGARALVVEFSDTGVGIEPEYLSKLWEPFFTTKPEGKGTGLGLPICRRTIEEHRGTIDIESLSGSGTTVRITLPVTEVGKEECD